MNDSEPSSEQIKDVLQGISIPPQPQIMVDLLIEQQNGDCTIDSVTKLIIQDVGLSGCILKTINSPFFGLTNKVASIQQAISLLGISRVINIVNSLSIRSSLSDENIINMTKFWDSAMEVALVSASVSREIGLSNPDEAYLLGLFHNCGNILMLRRFDDFARVVGESYAMKDRRIVDVENEVFQTNHCVVGYYISKAWSLPNHIAEAIRDHHSTDDIFADHDFRDTEKKNSLAILKMAENICATYQVLGEQTTDYEWARLETTILEYVGLSSLDYINLKENIEDMLALQE